MSQNQIPINMPPKEKKIVPLPVRKAFRWMNFHFREDGKIIRQMAKTLPDEQRKLAIEHGKDLCTARSKSDMPTGVRHVTTSLIVGQGMWYFACPQISKIPGIRDSALGWLAWGGSDKLFLSADQLLYHTGGYSSSYAAQLADKCPKTVMFGAAMLAIELATDFSRCFIEYWTQKKYGIVADGAARAYGQVRPFSVRYSSLEAYQKIISYALQPWTIGSTSQIFSSIQGFMGSLWRTGPQLLIVTTLGRAIDKALKRFNEWTGLSKVADRLTARTREAEKKAWDALRNALGEEKFEALRFQLGAESRALWKWNPFKPALSLDKAMEAAKVSIAYKELENALDQCGIPSARSENTSDLRRELGEMALRLESVFGPTTLKRLGAYREYIGCVEALQDALGAREGMDIGEKGKGKESMAHQAIAAFGKTIETLQSERRLA